MEELKKMLTEMTEKMRAKAEELGLENVKIKASYDAGYGHYEVECVDSDPDVASEDFVPHWRFHIWKPSEGEWEDLTEALNARP